MYSSTPQAGLASLLASRGRNGDSMLVHMTPGEVQGLQALALAHGGSLTINPETGLVEANFLKKILPVLAGAMLGPSGFGVFKTALGAATAVGLGVGIVEGDLKKGIMAGLGAYSGSNIASGLRAAATPASAAAASTTAPSALEAATPEQVLANKAAVAQTIGATPEAVTQSMPESFVSGGIQAAQALKAAPTVAAAPKGFDIVTQGLKNLATSPEARTRATEALGGGLSRYATVVGLADALTPEYKMPSLAEMEGDDLVYMPGERNPLYGTSADQPFFLPGSYYKRTPQGLVPVNLRALAPTSGRGFAAGGPVQPADQNMNQPRAIPHPYQPVPYPNQHYPLSTVTQGNYSPSMPQSGEIISGYEPQIDTYTGEENFAGGGSVEDDDRVYPPAEPGGTPLSPYAAPAATKEELRKRFEEMLYGPPTPPRDIQPMMDYLNALNEQAKKPIVAPSPVAPPAPPPPPPPPKPPGPPIGPPGGPKFPPDDGDDDLYKGPGDYTGPGGGFTGIGGGFGGIGGGGFGGSPFGPTPPAGGPPAGPTPPVAPTPPAAPIPPEQGGFGSVTGTVGRGVNAVVDYLRSTGGVMGAGLSLYDEIKKQIKAGDLDISKLLRAAFKGVIPDFIEEAYDELVNKAKNDADSETPPVAKAPEPEVGGGGGGAPDLGPGFGGPTSYVDNSMQNYLDQFALDRFMDPRRYEVSVDQVGMNVGGPADMGMNAGLGALAYPGMGPSYQMPTAAADFSASMGAPASFAPPTMGYQSPAMGTNFGFDVGMETPNPYGGAVGEDYNFGFAAGGMPGEYKAGGKLLNGPGDGMSDDIPAVIRGKGVQRAALADGEFVIPADVVSHLGNGSTNAGAKKLYKMMAQVRQARTGKTKQAPAVKMDKYLPA